MSGYVKIRPYVSKKKLLSNPIQNVSIVVNLYKEGMDWLKTPYISDFVQQARSKNIRINVYIYIKSDYIISADDKAILIKTFQNIKVTYLPNIGMGPHSMLCFLYTHYDDEGLVIFVPGSSANGMKIELYKNLLQNVLDYDYYFTCVGIRLDKNFTIEKYTVTDPRNMTSGSIQLRKASIRPFGKWYEHFTSKYKNLSLDVVNLANVKDIFGVRMDIIRRMPKEFYGDITKELSVAVAVEAGHYVERMWYPLIVSLSQEFV